MMSRYRWILLLALLLAAGCSGDSTPPPPTVSTLVDITLRAGPGSAYPEVAAVPKDTTVALLGAAMGRDCANWVLVRTDDGTEGWTAPVLVNVDIENSVLPAAPLPTPADPATPMPSTCTDGLALVRINNNLGKTMDVYLLGPESGFTLSFESDTSRQICIAPGDYCYDLTDGNKHQTGKLFFAGGRCTCWRWGGDQPQAGSCQCSEDPAQYERP